MKKKSWSRASNMRCATRALRRDKKFWKRKRSKGARRSNDTKGFYKSTGAWDLI